MSTRRSTVDYTYVQDEPTPDGRAMQEGPLITNMRKAMLTPGEWGRIATYPKSGTAGTVASALRRGERPVPRDTTLDMWEFLARGLDDDTGRYGIWARFLG